jgi:serine phosphatase RsbU (regulator of sigma subunit)
LERSGISYVNAGHEPVRRVEAGAVSTEDLEAELPLGVEHDHRYRIQQRPGFDVGDGVALFSDGVTGATSSEGMAFGPAALEKSLADSWGSFALLSAQTVVESVMAHIGSEQVRDDITVVLALRRDGSDGTS